MPPTVGSLCRAPGQASRGAEASLLPEGQGGPGVEHVRCNWLSLLFGGFGGSFQQSTEECGAGSLLPGPPGDAGLRNHSGWLPAEEGTTQIGQAEVLPRLGFSKMARGWDMV